MQAHYKVLAELRALAARKPTFECLDVQEVMTLKDRATKKVLDLELAQVLLDRKCSLRIAVNQVFNLSNVPPTDRERRSTSYK